MKNICDAIKQDSDKILGAWDQIGRDEPWLSLPKEHRYDGLPEVVAGLVEASLCNPGAEEAHREKVWAAVEHGVTRRRDGYDEPLLFAEYHLLRRALWDYVRRNTRPGEALEVITRIDTAISVATMASIRGYHRPELEAMGNWTDALRKLIEESPLLEHAGSTT